MGANQVGNNAFTQSSHVTGAGTVTSDPLVRSVASGASVRHSRLLDSNCCKLSAAASRTSRCKYLIARYSITASDDSSVEVNRTRARKMNIRVSTTSSVYAPVTIKYLVS